ncbi:ubiquitin carboxyl-terminal hydrolase [Thecamonas trahens ATCC 50062]|uniref:ubiquitinyl hydrolase 1 n=1 Tax=Thecamonas trahens ATCC 50062 TaxID=461836 RepID=A0A0L0DDV8_THETB|nr:ubiquitin carboxyl-terminal hydrolase [Thecamonas trahens ATCC 50062]KNC50517.1 ubiquitin carboxyl-terminal hydrolase [Thecamonas trahens ATCC 50062]|eukprot:XP_013762409.1 ubiquitin carboxyl-terminal hydrolase [Thecamonas trahens ATCC 50062]
MAYDNGGGGGEVRGEVPVLKVTSKGEVVALEAAVEASTVDGFLLKRGGTVINRWQKRRFVLANGLLYYFGRNANKSRGSIELAGCKVVDGHARKRFGIAIHHPAGRVYLLAALSAGSKRAWLRALVACPGVALSRASVLPTDCGAAVGDVPGARGLYNIGNTCYLAVVVQLISLISELSAFLRDNDAVSAELNETNVLGYGGRVARSVAALMQSLWAEAAALPATDDASAPVGKTKGRVKAKAKAKAKAKDNSGGGGAADNEDLAPPAALDPSEFKDVVARAASQFAGYQQHDAQEFLCWLLDALHEDLNRVQVKVAVPVAEAVAGESEEALAARAWHGYLLRNKSIVVDLLQGQLRSQVSCGKCGFASVTFDPFQYLTVPIPAKQTVKVPCVHCAATNASSWPITSLCCTACTKPFSISLDTLPTPSLDECLELFCKRESLTKGNQWYCPKCETHVDATKQVSLYKTPPFLLIILKRFAAVRSGRRGKVHLPVSYPVELDLSHIVSSPQPSEPRYELRGMLEEQLQSRDAYILLYAPPGTNAATGAAPATRPRRQTISKPSSWPHAIGPELVAAFKDRYEPIDPCQVGHAVDSDGGGAEAADLDSGAASSSATVIATTEPGDRSGKADDDDDDCRDGAHLPDAASASTSMSSTS